MNKTFRKESLHMVEAVPDGASQNREKSHDNKKSQLTSVITREMH